MSDQPLPPNSTSEPVLSAEDIPIELLAQVRLQALGFASNTSATIDELIANAARVEEWVIRGADE